MEAVLEATLEYEDMFLDNGRPDGSTRKRHVAMVPVPGQRGLIVCIQEQNDVFRDDSRRRYRYGMDIGVDTWTRGMIPVQNVDKRMIEP